MSLLKRRVMTPARWAANRGNALKSTGPRTARGKAQSRLNGLRYGFCSPAYRRFWLALFEAPPGYPVAKTVCSMLTAAEYYHPVYAELVDVHFEMEMEDHAMSGRIRRQHERKALQDQKRSREAIENNGPAKIETRRTWELIENKHLMDTSLDLIANKGR
jgi:hypothetical protein